MKTFTAKNNVPKKTHVAYNPRIMPKEDDNENFKQFWAIFGQKEELGAIYIVSSVNNWLPIKLNDPATFAEEKKDTERQPPRSSLRLDE